MNETEKDFYLLMRRKKKISQNELGDHLEVTQAYISMFETNAKQLPQHYIDKYKKYILDK
ncbi:helix-turn-helix transcriptional regulator [Neobacillus sp. PS3-40]|uniref:helix-turn-helix transcriptional regulator n=1 Tax=Neobacillus sp. PS3-40 TaxID=3070679 RepID=UPI0027DF6BDE|nr:helix-turn-helix transcriptional regulator [Neobacillus sp. PS3-40]WML44062.1 helix-turn-helix transcriptional regulator [Neobacillus sp. PS3-40]